MNTIEQKKAKIAKLKGLGRDVSKYEAKLLPKEEEKPDSSHSADAFAMMVAKPIRRPGRPPRHG